MSQEIRALLTNKVERKQRVFLILIALIDHLCQLLFTYFTFKEKVIYECVIQKMQNFVIQ
jgi:Na+/H+ antiporter NhaA